jgi:hypothetical protein
VGIEHDAIGSLRLAPLARRSDFVRALHDVHCLQLSVACNARAVPRESGQPCRLKPPHLSVD